jgi:hypothetical protein
MKIWEDFWNMNSSNFLTHKIGEKRISIGGGAKSMIVFQARLLTGKFTDQYGKTTELGDRFGKQINTRFDLITNFIAGKSSPVISVAVKKAQEKKGLEVDDAELIRDVTIPIWMQDLKEMYKNDPTTVNAILTAFSLFGANVRAVDPSKQSQGNTINIKDAEKGTKRQATQEEYKKYVSEKETMFEKEMKRLENQFIEIDRYGDVIVERAEGSDEFVPDDEGKSVKFKDLTPDQKKQLETKIKRQMSAKAKKQIFGEGQDED